MSTSTSFSPLRIAGIATASLLVAAGGYAVYFDHRRRHDPVFRKKLAKQHKKLSQVKEAGAAATKEEIAAALKRAVALANADPVPVDVEGKEQYFMEQVGMGEQLAARSPEFYVAAAIAFFKALKVYPAPHELIMIYQKTQPQAVFELVMELVTLDVSTSRAPPAASISQVDPRDTHADALLEPVEPTATPAPALVVPADATPAVPVSATAVEDPATPAQTPAPAAPASDNGSSPSTGSSFVHVQDEVDAVLDAAAEKAEEVKEAVEEKAEDASEVAAEVEEAVVEKAVEVKEEVLV